jgi:adenylate cyclase
MKFWNELKRRQVVQSGVAYLIVAWGLAQVADLLLENFAASDWVMQWILICLGLGFPIALIIAWFYKITLAGFLREEVISKTQGNSNARIQTPSIVVLPFKNLSPDEDQDLFAAAITNDIMQGLTQTSFLSVVSSGAATTENELEFNVDFLLQGSVNRIGDNLRVSARLTEVQDSIDIWSNQYDRQLTANSLFEMQDDICEQLVATLGNLHGVVYSTETHRNMQRPTNSLNAYQCLAVALGYDKHISEENHLLARQSLEQAVKLDPGYGSAWGHLSWIYTDEYVYGYNPLPDSMTRALSAARKGLQMAPNHYHSHWLLARVYYFNGEKEMFLAEAERSLTLNSRDSTTLGLIGCYMGLSGDSNRGMELIKKAMTLNPNYPGYLHWFLAVVLFQDENYAEAQTELIKANLHEWHLYLLLLAACSDQIGNRELKLQCIGELKEIHEEFDMDDVRKLLNRFLVFLPELAQRIHASVSAEY